MILFINLCLIFLFLIFLLVILYYIFDKYSWEAYLNSCEKLRPVNHYGEKLKNKTQFNINTEKKIDYISYYSYSWYHPIIEDIERQAKPILTHNKTVLFKKTNLNITKKNIFKNPSLFLNERHAQIILSKKDYKLFHKNYEIINSFDFLNYESVLFYNIRFIDPFFLTDTWSQVLPPYRGVKSCANYT